MKRRSVWVVEGNYDGKGWRPWHLREDESFAKLDMASAKAGLRGTAWKFRVVRYDASK